MSDFTSADAATRKAAQAKAVELGAPMIAPLFRLLTEDSPAHVATVENTLFTIATRATAPDAQDTRTRVSSALQAELVGASAKCRAFAARLLGVVADDEDALRELALALEESDTHTTVLTAIQRIPGDAASVTLITALTAASPQQRVGVAHALGARGDRVALDPLIRWARDGDTGTRVASLQALGQIGSLRARGVLESSVAAEDPRVASAACAGLLRLADAARADTPAISLRLYEFVAQNGLLTAQKHAAALALQQLSAAADGNAVAPEANP